MKVKINRYLVEVYKPWGEAKAVWERMSDEELEKIESRIDSWDIWDETRINDFFWFEDETWLDIIGETEENFYKRPKQRELK